MSSRLYFLFLNTLFTLMVTTNVFASIGQQATTDEITSAQAKSIQARFIAGLKEKNLMNPNPSFQWDTSIETLKVMDNFVLSATEELKELKSLSINEPIHPFLIPTLAKYGCFENLDELNLEDAKVGTNGIFALGMNFFEGILNPTTLNLKNNGINDEGAKILMLAIKRARQLYQKKGGDLALKTLDLEGNLITKEGVEFVAERSPTYLKVRWGNKKKEAVWKSRRGTEIDTDETKEFEEAFKWVIFKKLPIRVLELLGGESSSC